MARRCFRFELNYLFIFLTYIKLNYNNNITFYFRKTISNVTQVVFDFLTTVYISTYYILYLFLLMELLRKHFKPLNDLKYLFTCFNICGSIHNQYVTLLRTAQNIFRIQRFRLKLNKATLQEFTLLRTEQHVLSPEENHGIIFSGDI